MKVVPSFEMVKSVSFVISNLWLPEFDMDRDEAAEAARRQSPCSHTNSSKAQLEHWCGE